MNRDVFIPSNEQLCRMSLWCHSVNLDLSRTFCQWMRFTYDSLVLLFWLSFCVKMIRNLGILSWICLFYNSCFGKGKTNIFIKENYWKNVNKYAARTQVPRICYTSSCKQILYVQTMLIFCINIRFLTKQ